MRVELIDYQENARELLIFTKSTRLQAGQTLTEIELWSEEKKQEHLDYMMKTIQSSWEFAGYIFKISDVTRAFTHQLVRTRPGSYAQESQRTIDARDNGYLIPDGIRADQNNLERYCDSMAGSIAEYADLINNEANIQDARGVLPTNLYTSIIAKFDLRTLSNMASLRLCKRTQGEYQEVFKLMKAAVVEVHPWAEEFMEVHCVKTGLCAFPNYEECPIQIHTIEFTKWKKLEIEKAWSESDHVAVPVAKDGMTMNETSDDSHKCLNCKHFPGCDRSSGGDQNKCEDFKWDEVPF